MASSPKGRSARIFDLRPRLLEKATQQSIADEMHLGMTLQALYPLDEVNRMIAERRERQDALLEALGDNVNPCTEPEPPVDLDELYERFFDHMGFGDDD